MRVRSGLRCFDGLVVVGSDPVNLSSESSDPFSPLRTYLFMQINDGVRTDQSRARRDRAAVIAVAGAHERELASELARSWFE